MRGGTCCHNTLSYFFVCVLLIHTHVCVFVFLCVSDTHSLFKFIILKYPDYEEDEEAIGKANAEQSILRSLLNKLC